MVIRDGHLLRAQMDREGVTDEEVEAALHEHGIARIQDVQTAVLAALREFGVDRLDEVKLAVLETDGSLSVGPYTPAEERSARE